MFSVQLRDNCYVHYFYYHSFYKGIRRRTENSILQQRTGQWGDIWERRKRRKKHLNQRCGAICHFPQGLLSLEDLFQDFEFNLHLTLRAWASVQGGTFDLFYICPCHSWCLNTGFYLKLKWSKCCSLPRASKGNLCSPAFLGSTLSLPPQTLHWDTGRGSCMGSSPDELLSHSGPLAPEKYVKSPFWVCGLVLTKESP